MEADAGCVRPEWVLVMDTSVLLCYFEHLGYHMESGQCQDHRMDEFRETVCDGRRKIILDACGKQIYDKFGESYPEVFRQGDETWKGNRGKGRRRPPLKVTNADPEEVLNRIHRSLREDFEPFKIRIPPEKRNQIRDRIKHYLTREHLDNPESAGSKRWIHAKRHILQNMADGGTGEYSSADGNRIKIRYLIDEMMKKKDLDMLVQAQIMTERDCEMKVLFVSADNDHTICHPHMWKETGGRMSVQQPDEAVKWASRWESQT